MNLTYYGHSCFSVTILEKVLLFDPFITLNELANKIIDVDGIAADYILVSHGHQDHIADCIRIASRTGAKIICNVEIEEWLNKQGIENIHSMSSGGKWNFGPFTVKCTVAQHSSGLPGGSYGGNPMGFIIISQDESFYYSGDTALTLDMQLIPKWAKLNFAVLPIGDNFTMDAADAAACAGMVECRTVLGVHYDTSDVIKIDKSAAKKIFAAAGVELKLVQIGGSVEM
ncbi:MAG: metal-dependent hydrolase [Chitinophagaceae bacterium]